MKKIIKTVLVIPALIVLLPVLVFVGRFVQLSRKIDIQDGNECWNVPPAACHIFAKGSYLGFVSQFSISQQDMVAYATSRGWIMSEITNQVDAMTVSTR